MSIAQALAMTVAEIPVFLYSTFGQVNRLYTHLFSVHRSACYFANEAQMIFLYRDGS